MDYCAPLGIPHSHFLGGPQRWTEYDQDKALAWQEGQRARCPECGSYPEEWIDEDGVPYEEPPYEVTSYKCFGCKSLEEEREYAREAKADFSGLVFFLVRNAKAALNGLRNRSRRQE